VNTTVTEKIHNQNWANYYFSLQFFQGCNIQWHQWTLTTKLLWGYGPQHPGRDNTYDCGIIWV